MGSPAASGEAVWCMNGGDVVANGETVVIEAVGKTGGVAWLKTFDLRDCLITKVR